MTKMASSNFLDDVLNTEADESAVSALVGSLESQLASSTSQSVLVDSNHSNVNVNLNSGLAFQAGPAAAVTLAGNGSHATPTCTPTSTCNIAVPATATSLQLQSTTIHSLLPNGNLSGTQPFMTNGPAPCCGRPGPAPVRPMSPSLLS